MSILFIEYRNNAVNHAIARFGNIIIVQQNLSVQMMQFRSDANCSPCRAYLHLNRSNYGTTLKPDLETLNVYCTITAQKKYYIYIYTLLVEWQLFERASKVLYFQESFLHVQIVNIIINLCKCVIRSKILYSN